MNDRRKFLTALFTAPVPPPRSEVRGEGVEPFRPLLPGFVAEQSAGCATCTTSACQVVCPEGVVIRQGTDHPYLDLSKRGCTFCGECQNACPSGCFESTPIKRLRAEVKIHSKKCLAWQSTICRSCADVCNVRAIRFEGLWQPVIDTSICTACGFCIGRCPTESITIRPIPTQPSDEQTSSVHA